MKVTKSAIVILLLGLYFIGTAHAVCMNKQHKIMRTKLGKSTASYACSVSPKQTYSAHDSRRFYDQETCRTCGCLSVSHVSKK